MCADTAGCIRLFPWQTGAKPYTCNTCGKSYPRTDALKRHWKAEGPCRANAAMQLQMLPADGGEEGDDDGSRSGSGSESDSNSGDEHQQQDRQEVQVQSERERERQRERDRMERERELDDDDGLSQRSSDEEPLAARASGIHRAPPLAISGVRDD